LPLIFAAMMALLGVAIAYSVLGWYVVHGPVNERTMTSAVARESHAADSGSGCKQVQGRQWRCEVSDSQESGEAIYLVTVGEGACFTGRRAGSRPGESPRHIDGCVRLLRDQ
jgi:hypothetical protein